MAFSTALPGENVFINAASTFYFIMYPKMIWKLHSVLIFMLALSCFMFVFISIYKVSADYPICIPSGDKSGES